MTVITEVTLGHLHECELFFFTDNSTAEAAFHMGTSSSPRLFKLILQLLSLQMYHSLFLHVIHVSNKLMLHQETTGLSHGDLTSGILQGLNLLDFVPLHHGALDREPLLSHWLSTWLSYATYLILTLFDWFTTGYQEGCHVWSSPPPAAEVALEQAAFAIHMTFFISCFHHFPLISHFMAQTFRQNL